MPIYINKDNQQSGPYEDHVVIEQLRGGQLSPTDLGIRQGESAWQKLGDMFPGLASGSTAEPTVGAKAANASDATTSAVPTPKKGGCLKGGLIGTGILFLFLGIAIAIGGQYIPSVSCDLAESDARNIDKLRSDIDKAKSDGKFDRIGPLGIQLDQELAGAEVSQKYCNDDKFRNNAVSIAGGVVAALGLLMTLVGLFVGRRK